MKRRNRREQAAERAALNAAYDRAMAELSKRRAVADALRHFAARLMREIEDAEIEAEQETRH